MAQTIIVYKHLEELTPYENNPRFNDNAVPYVAESIKRFGFKQPIVCDKDGVIVAGHTRYKAAMQLGLTEVPCIIADDLTPDEVKAYRLADNKVGELASWDMSALNFELSDIDEIEMGDFGFEQSEINDIQLDEPNAPNDEQGDLMHCPKCGFVFEAIQ